MRSLLVAILCCALGSPAASAQPGKNPRTAPVSQRGAVAQATHSKATHAQTRSHRHGRDLGGIHPLVDSGDY